MSPSQDPHSTESHADDEEHPRGTLVILLFFLAAIVVSWTYVYVLMWNRG